MYFGRTVLARLQQAVSIAFGLALVCALGTSPRGAAAASRTSDEIGALATAETFGYAWVTRDARLGAATTDFGQTEGSPGPDAMRGYFVGLSSPHHAAFAVERMRRMAAEDYACTLTLYEYLYAGHGHGDYDGKTVTIELKKRNGTWKVVTAPGLYGS